MSFPKAGGNDILIDQPGDRTEQDSIVFNDVPSDEVAIHREYTSLVLVHRLTGDRLTIGGYFGDCAIEQIRFADGVTWGVDFIRQQVIQASAGNDHIVGYDEADSLWGGRGNDHLEGEAGDDTLSGGKGNDILWGGEGNDLLNGGQGDDTLGDGEGADIYYFERGWGQDTLSDQDYSNTGKDVIRFAEGISPADLRFSRTEHDLIIRFGNG